MGIWLCLLMMLLVLAMVLTGVFDASGKDADRLVSATAPDDAVYVNASPKPQETLPTPTQKVEEVTTAFPDTTTETAAAETERKPLYYVTVSGSRIVLLDEYGEYLDTLNENALFLPPNDLSALRAGIALYSKDELSALADDLS
jgi:hypothetical protein